MGIRLDQVNVVVGDMEAMADFYGRLGIDLSDGGLSQWAPHHRSGRVQDGAGVDLDSVAFASKWNTGWPGGSGVVLGFRVDERPEVDRLYRELTAAGYASQQAPLDAFFGARVAFVVDPDGNTVGIMSPRDPAFRSEGPEPPFTE